MLLKDGFLLFSRHSIESIEVFKHPLQWWHMTMSQTIVVKPVQFYSYHSDRKIT